MSKMPRSLKFRSPLGPTSLEDIPTTSATNYPAKDSTSSESEVPEPDGEYLPKVTPARYRGSSYLKTRKDYEKGQKLTLDNLQWKDRTRELDDSSEWDTEEEPTTSASPKKDKSKRRPSQPSADPQQGKKDVNFEDQFNPARFGYVSLSDKVLVDYDRRLKLERMSERMRYGSPRVQEGTRKSESYDLDNCGGEFVIPPPLMVLEKTDETDPIGIKSVEEILNSPDLTISQKYRSLGVEEDPFDEGPDEGGGCWEWFLYKLNSIYLSQWPMSKAIS